MNVNGRKRGHNGHTVDRSSGKWTIVETLGGTMAVMLIASPWMYRYSNHAVATWTSVVIGSFLGVATVMRTAIVGNWQRWASLGLGLCALLSPWLFGFSAVSNAAGLLVTVGIVVIMMNVLALGVEYLEERQHHRGLRP